VYTTYLNKACCILSLFILLNHLIIVLVSRFSLPRSENSAFSAFFNVHIYNQSLNNYLTYYKSFVSVLLWPSVAVQTRLLIIASSQKTVFQSLILRCIPKSLFYAKLIRLMTTVYSLQFDILMASMVAQQHGSLRLVTQQPRTFDATIQSIIKAYQLIEETL
jgi:hypothetical protein